MNNYESTVVLKSDTTKVKQNEIINKFNNMTKEVKVNELGKKVLAYTVKGYKEGIYIVFNFKSTNKINKELQEYLRNNTNILKYIILKEED